LRRLLRTHKTRLSSGQVLHVEYAELEKEYGILFTCSLFCEYIHLECVRTHVTYRVDKSEYAIHILVVASQKYVNIYSTRRVTMLFSGPRSKGGGRVV